MTEGIIKTARGYLTQWAKSRALELKQSGLTYVEIGNELGVNPRTVQAALWKSGNARKDKLKPVDPECGDTGLFNVSQHTDWLCG